MKLKRTLLATALATAGLPIYAGMARVVPISLPSPAEHGFPTECQDFNVTVLDPSLADANNHGAFALPTFHKGG